MKKLFIVLLSLLCALPLLTGCKAVSGDNAKRKRSADFAPDVDAQPDYSQFGRELQDLGKLARFWFPDLADLGRAEIFYVMPNELRVAADENVRSEIVFALRQINAVLVMDTPLALELDLTRTNGVVERSRNPDVIVSSFIAGRDEAFRTTREGDLRAGFPGFAGGAEGEVSGGKTREGGYMRLQIRLSDFKTRVGLPWQEVELVATWSKQTDRRRVGLFISLSGAQAQREEFKVTSQGECLRGLARRGVLLAIAKHFELPWWRVVPGRAKDEKFIEDLLNLYRQNTSAAAQSHKVKRIQRLLTLLYPDTSLPATGNLDPATQQLVARFVRDEQLQSLDDLDLVLVRLYEVAPISPTSLAKEQQYHSRSHYDRSETPPLSNIAASHSIRAPQQPANLANVPHPSAAPPGQKSNDHTHNPPAARKNPNSSAWIEVLNATNHKMYLTFISAENGGGWQAAGHAWVAEAKQTVRLNLIGVMGDRVLLHAWAADNPSLKWEGVEVGVCGAPTKTITKLIESNR